MNKSRFTELQIAFSRQQAESGTTIGEVYRKIDVSEQTFCRWKKRYGGLMPSELRRLKQLEEKNTRQRLLPSTIIGNASDKHPASTRMLVCRGISDQG